MHFSRVRPRTPGRRGTEATAAGAYADLDDLVRMQYGVYDFSFLPRQPVRSLLAGRRASRLRGRGLDFEEIRRYVPGDDIRTMDWRVTARIGKPHARVYTEERDHPLLLVVDQRIAMFFGSRVCMKSVTAAEVAALAAWRTLHSGDRVGALVFNDSAIEEIPPHRSRHRVTRILETVVRMNHALQVNASIRPDHGALNRVMQRAHQLAPHDCLVVVVSDFDGADDETRRLVTRVAAHNDVVAVFVHDPLEAHVPAMGRVVVSQANLQLEIDTADARFRQRFAQEFEDRLARARGLMLARGIPVLPVQTTGPVRDQLGELLGHRPPRARS